MGDREPARPRARLAAIAVVVMTAWIAIAALAVEPTDSLPPRLVPRHLPDGISADRSTWTYATDNQLYSGTEYGHVGADGRLDVWLQLLRTATQAESFTSASQERDGRRMWFTGVTRDGLASGSVEVPGCGIAYFKGTSLGQPLVDALYGATCQDGLPTIEPFAGMRSLCRKDYSVDTWVLDAPRIDGARDLGLRVIASRDTCPVASSTGLPYGVERFLYVDGRRVALWTNGGSIAGATLRMGRYSIFVAMNLPHDLGPAIEDEMVLVLQGLQRADDAEWAELTTSS